MSQIEIIKATIAPADAARQYGLSVHRNGMALYPFHNDTHPSMKLYDDHFYCFACGAYGDVIGLAAKLLGLNFTEVVHRIAVDFGIDPDKPPTAMPVRPYLAQFRKDETLCISVLTEYEQQFRRWKTECAPKTPDDEIDDRFVEACQMLDQIEYLADFLCAAELEERVKAVDELIQNGFIEKLLKQEIYHELKFCAVKNVPHTINNIVELLKFYSTGIDLTPKQDRVHLANGTLFVDGTYVEEKSEVVRSRLPIRYNPDAPRPEKWLRFLHDLLHEEDIPTLQEYLGYCLIPSTKGQRMMVIKGKGGEGKSQIGVVLNAIFGSNMKDGSIGKVSENRFARADLEHQLLMIDDDMKMEALKQTNYVKSIVTAQGKMDLERKGRQSYQGWMFCRLLAFSNGDLQALYDRSNGFYRRQLILTTKEKSDDRIDDPDIADKMKAEAEGVFLWMFEGLQRLIANKYQFTESERIHNNREYVKRDSNNLIDFMEDEGYVRLKADCGASSKEIYETYTIWCEENAMTPLKPRSVSDFLVENEKKYNLEHTNTITNSAGRRVWGFLGIELLVNPYFNSNLR